MDQPPEPLTLYPSRWKTLAFLALSLLFAGFSVLILHEGKRSGLGWGGLGLFGMSAAVMAAQLAPGLAHLRLERDGFVERSLWHEHRRSWGECCRFRVGTLGFDSAEADFAMGLLGLFVPGAGKSKKKTVVFDLKDVATSAAMRRLMSYDGSLADTYGQRPEALAATMNSWKARHDQRAREGRACS